MGGPQSAAQKLNRKEARKHGRPSSTMKPEHFAQGEQVRPFKPLNLRVDVDSLEDVNPASPHTVNSSAVGKHMVDTKTASSLAKPLYPRGHFCSSFLQPEQFLAELRVHAGAAKQLDISVDTSRRSEPQNEPASFKPPSPHLNNLPEPYISKDKDDGSEGIQQVAHVTQVVPEPEPKPGSEKDLESFYEPANSVPTLELCYEGKPAPAPAHLRTRTAQCTPTNSTLSPEKLNNTIVSESAQPVSDKNSEEPSNSCVAVDSPHSPELQKSSSQGSGRFFKTGSPSLHKMREKLVRSLSGKKENSFCEGGDAAGIQGSTTSSPHCQPIEGHGVKQTGRLRRMLHWGGSRTGSMEFLKSVERKLGKKSGKNGQIGGGVDSGEKVEPRVDASQSEQEVSGCGESTEIFDEECCSPRSSASSVSTTYSEVSSKWQSYKQSHRKNHRSEAVKSKLWMLRVHQKLQGGATRKSEDEDDGIFEALRQGAMFHDVTTTDTAASKEEDGNILNGSEKNAISKLVAKHKRNSTWDAGKLSLTDHIFSPKQPRLPTRDAHVLLAPPKRLTGDTREPDLQGRKGKSPLLNARAAPEQQAAASLTADESPQIAQAVKLTTTRNGQVLPPLPSQESSLKSVASNGSTSPGRSARRAPQNYTVSPGRAELPTPPASPGDLLSSQRSSFRAFPGFTSPLPLPVRAETQSTPNSPGLSATSLGSRTVPKSPPTLSLAGGGGMQVTSTSPTLHRASATSPGMSSNPGGVGFQSSLMAGLDATSRRYAGNGGLNTVEQFSLEESPGSTNSPSVQATRVAPQEPRSRLQSDSAGTRNGVKEPKPREASVERVSPDKHKPVGGNALPLPTSSRPQVLSFEQIVAGRGRSPPTDNTLMKFFFKCREIEHLNKFLALQKRRFLDSSNTDEKCFHMILSEAGAGLSSMVSTLCTAWLLENTMASATSAKWHPIPVMNMSQKDMWQHRDAAWLFHVCGIDANAVLFLDEIKPTNETVISGRVKRAVIGQDILVIKDEVASSCTIVSEKFRQEAPKLLQARYLMTLLLAGILVDTQNLSSGSPRDKQQATILLVGAGSLGRNGFYNHLMNIRDENYVTSFIKEIYGDSHALTGEKPAQLAPGTQQSKTISSSWQNDKMPASLAASIVSNEVTTPISPPLLPSENSITKSSHKSEFEAESYDDTKESPSKKNLQTQTRAPQNSKISLALRLLRNRLSVQ